MSGINPFHTILTNDHNLSISSQKSVFSEAVGSLYQLFNADRIVPGSSISVMYNELLIEVTDYGQSIKSQLATAKSWGSTSNTVNQELNILYGISAAADPKSMGAAIAALSSGPAAESALLRIFGGASGALSEQLISSGSSIASAILNIIAPAPGHSAPTPPPPAPNHSAPTDKNYTDFKAAIDTANKLAKNTGGKHHNNLSEVTNAGLEFEGIYKNYQKIRTLQMHRLSWLVWRTISAFLMLTGSARKTRTPLKIHSSNRFLLRLQYSMA
jgi:hypothetical protein